MKLDPKLQRTQIIITAMTDNANFPAPNPPLGDLATLRTNIIAKTNAIDSMKVTLDTEIAERDLLIQQLDDGLVQEAAYVQTVSGGKTEIILSAGMEVANTPAPIGPLAPPQNIQAFTSDNEGQVETKWDKVIGGSSYVVECATNPNGPWTQVVVATRANYTATGLVSGTKYWFHVRAVGAAGPGPWSEPVVKMAA
ncbi:MAG: fibronectin type III domain-containing protein [Verrucomicrobia bacterium]|nr:fibronectin type III domain-containing protein [Verrucomicrobiota bacterium]